MVPKADGGWCPCGDFRQLNNATDNDRYPIPHIQDFSDHLASAKVFCKVDLVRRYHQVPVHPLDITKTVKITPFGLFQFLRMPFGLKEAAQTFKFLIDSVLRGLPFLFVYLDDILVASSSVPKHLEHLSLLFNRLSEHGLVMNPSNSQFGLSSTEFLGHLVSPQGVVPLPAKVRAVVTFPHPASVKSLQEFLGMVNFYNRFIPRAAHLTYPLYDALRGKKGNQAVVWTQDMLRVFDEAKMTLADAALLAHSTPGAPVALTTDSSDFAIGGVCEQWVGGA
uniref:ribonuclease H n=1 Tax=Nothobranchius furzeri TaxID=105023 RepID=A0A1A8A9I8_NOTFU